MIIRHSMSGTVANTYHNIPSGVLGCKSGCSVARDMDRTQGLLKETHTLIPGMTFHEGDHCILHGRSAQHDKYHDDMKYIPLYSVENNKAYLLASIAPWPLRTALKTRRNTYLVALEARPIP